MKEGLMLTRETVTFRDGNGWSWEFDLTFMLSNYRCIWGRGCPDTRLERSARGCCVDGVEIYRGDRDRPGREDLKKIRGRVRQLTDEDWQNRRVALARGGHEPWGKARFKSDSVRTRVYRGACIFHNGLDHLDGPGCALHVAALRTAENAMDWKPRICWQVPLFFDIDDKTKTTTVRACRTVDWGGEGYLTGGAPSIRTRSTPINRCASPWSAELRRACGDAVYGELAAYCQARRNGEPRRLTLLPMIP
jgi:hypothetical protein